MAINEDVVLSLVSEMLKAIADYAKHDRAEFVRVVQDCLLYTSGTYWAFRSRSPAATAALFTMQAKPWAAVRTASTAMAWQQTGAPSTVP